MVGVADQELAAEGGVASDRFFAARFGEVAITIRILRHQPVESSAGRHLLGDFGIAAEVLERRVAADRGPEAGGVADQRQLRKRLQRVFEPRQAGRVRVANVVEMKQDRQADRLARFVQRHLLRSVEPQPGLVLAQPSAAGVLIPLEDVADPLHSGDVPRALARCGDGSRIDGAERNDPLRIQLERRNRRRHRLSHRSRLRRNQRQHARLLHVMLVHEPHEQLGRQLLPEVKRSEMRVDVDVLDLASGLVGGGRAVAVEETRGARCESGREKLTSMTAE